MTQEQPKKGTSQPSERIFSVFPAWLTKDIADSHGKITAQYKRKADIGFQYGAALLLGFAPPWIMLTGPQSVQLPIILFGLLVALRLLMRPAYGPQLLQAVKRPPLLFLVLLTLYVTAHVINATLNGQGTALQLRGYSIAVMIALATLLFAYLSITKAEPFREALRPAYICGLVLFIVIFALDCLKGQMVLAYYAGPGSNSSGQDFIKSAFFPMRQLSRASEVFAVLLFPAALIFHAKPLRNLIPGLAILLFALSFLSVGLIGTQPGSIGIMQSESIQIGLIAALLAFILSRYFPAQMTNLAFAGLIIPLLIAPWLFQLLNLVLQPYQEWLVPTLARRLEIWGAVSDAALEAPIFGSGIFSMRQLTSINLTAMPQHPHNGFLQIWLDLGAVGALIVAALLASAWRIVTTLPLATRPAINATITILTIIVVSTHSLWQVWFFCLLIAVAALVSILAGQVPDVTVAAHRLNDVTENGVKGNGVTDASHVSDDSDGLTSGFSGLPTGHHHQPALNQTARQRTNAPNTITQNAIAVISGLSAASLGLALIFQLLFVPGGQQVADLIKLPDQYSSQIFRQDLKVAKLPGYVALIDHSQASAGWLLLRIDHIKALARHNIQLVIARPQQTTATTPEAQFRISYKKLQKRDKSNGFLPRYVFHFDQQTGRIRTSSDATAKMVSVQIMDNNWVLRLQVAAPGVKTSMRIVLLPAARPVRAVGSLKIKSIQLIKTP